MRATTAPIAVGTAVEVRCHPGCPWMDRFVVEDVACLDSEPAYRVDRADSGLALSILVPASDVRVAERC